MTPTMGRISVVTDFILLASYTLLCNSEPVNTGELSLGQKAIFRHPMPVPVPAQSVQASFQNLRGPAPSQEFIQIPMEVQTQRTNYLYPNVPLDPNRPLQGQVNFGLSKPAEQRYQSPSQTQQGFQKPMPGPVFQPVVRDQVVIQSEFEVKMPVPANTVEVYCGEDSVKVQAQQDFLGNHQFIDPSDLTLGGCPFVGFDDHARIVVFESALQGCGSTLMVDSDLHYINALFIAVHIALRHFIGNKGSVNQSVSS